MALHWEWNNKIGEVTDSRGQTANLYRGNAFMIAIHEWTEGESELYNLAWFFVDKDHCKRCLGIGKDADKINFDWVKFKLDTSEKNTETFIGILAKAGIKVTIELY